MMKVWKMEKRGNINVVMLSGCLEKTVFLFSQAYIF